MQERTRNETKNVAFVAFLAQTTSDRYMRFHECNDGYQWKRRHSHTVTFSFFRS